MVLRVPAIVPKLVCFAPLALAYWTGLAGAGRRIPPRILMYHGITPGVARSFERQLRFLRRRFRVVPLGELLDALRAGEGGLEGMVALTFDDGLRNNVRVAYPILERLGLSATFFVCPGLAASGRWLWNHEMRQRLLRLDETGRRRVARELGHGDPGVEGVVSLMKRMSLAMRLDAEARVRTATRGFSPTPEEREAFDVAGWEELRRLDASIVTIGSHSFTHPILPSLGPEDLEAEMRGSRRELEEKLGHPVEFFAYPNGDQNPDVRASVRRHYRAAVTADSLPLTAACDPYLLPRDCPPAGALRLAWELGRTAAA